MAQFQNWKETLFRRAAFQFSALFFLSILSVAVLWLAPPIFLKFWILHWEGRGDSIEKSKSVAKEGGSKERDSTQAATAQGSYKEKQGAILIQMSEIKQRPTRQNRVGISIEINS